MMELLRTMSGLSPVARIASPSRVRRKRLRKRIPAATNTRITSSLYCPERTLSFSRSFARVKTVVFFPILTWLEPPITAMLTE